MIASLGSKDSLNEITRQWNIAVILKELFYEASMGVKIIIGVDL